MEPLHAEDLHSLEQQIPHLRSSEPLMYLAERKLLPQQHDLESFENPSILTRLRRMTYGHTREEKQLMKRQQEALVPFQQEQQIKTKLRTIQEFQMANAPTAAVANARYGLPLEPSQLAPAPDTSFVGPMPGVRTDVGFGQGFTPEEMAQPINGAQTRGEALLPLMQQRAEPYYTEAPRTSLQPDPSAKLKPYQLEQVEDVRAGRGQFEDGQFVPMAQLKPRPDLVSPEQFAEEVKVHQKLGNFDEATATALLKAPPDRPLPRASVQAAFTDAARRKLEAEKIRGTHTLDDTAIAVTGVPMSEIANDATVTLDHYNQVKSLVPGSSVKIGDNLKKTIGALKAVDIPVKVAGSKAAAATSATQNVSLVPPEKQSNYIHADTYANSGKIVYPSSTQDDPFTLAKAATGGWKEITDKQKEAIKAIEVARNTQSTLLDLAHQLIKAQGPTAAFAQGMKAKFGAFIRSNPVAAAFIGDKEAFSGWMARMVEVGVLTQQDIQRWASVLPDERDTIGSAVEKEAVLNMLFDAAELANRRAILGDVKGLESAKKSLQDQIEDAAKLYGKGKKKSATELFNETFGGKK